MLPVEEKQLVGASFTGRNRRMSERGWGQDAQILSPTWRLPIAADRDIARDTVAEDRIGPVQRSVAVQVEAPDSR
jgi:hypothetical protein